MKNFFASFKRYLQRSDTFLLVLCLISTAYGMVLISSAIRYTGSMRPLYVQIGATVIGLGLYFLFSLVDIDIISTHWRGLTLFGLALIASLVWLGDAEGATGRGYASPA